MDEASQSDKIIQVLAYLKLDNGKGERYLFDAVRLYGRDRCSLCEIYRRIAERYGCSRASVERAVRRLKEKALSEGLIGKLNDKFRQNIYQDYEYITNKELIVAVCEISGVFDGDAEKMSQNG